MWTETYGQMLDRLIIARLKAYHYTQSDKPEAAELAEQQCTELKMALGRYVEDCTALRALPRVQKHLRFHDHNKVEGWREGKQATPPAPDTIEGCIDALAGTHCDYWDSQSRIQTLKQLIDRTSVERERQDFEGELVHLQRRHIDLDNQHRSELVQRIDELFCVRIERATRR